MYMATHDTMQKLGMMQISDSFFPAGLFAASGGLEKLFLDRTVTNVNQLTEFARICLEQQVGPGDCTILACAHDYSRTKNLEAILEADMVCTCIKTVKEVREASFRSGVQIARCVREFASDDVLSWFWSQCQNGKATGSYPVSLAVCANALHIPKEESTLMILYGFAASAAGAALRLGIIQHFESQKMIHDLKPLMAKISGECCAKSLDDVWQFSPQLEINQMSHEGMDSKMFIT